MADYLTLTEFVPGTKAKAQEVNANFSILKDAINLKAVKSGDGTQNFSVANATTDLHAVNKRQMDALSADFTTLINKGATKFCVKSGNVTGGKGDLFSYDVLRITPKIGGAFADLVFADYEGTVTTISSTPSSISMTGKADGTYNIFIKPSGALYTLSNKIYRQPARPTMLDGDVWLNTSVEPLKAIKYDGTNDTVFLDIPLGKVTIASGAIVLLQTFQFNQNGYNINANTPSYKYDYANPINKSAGVNYTAESDGLVYACGTNTSTTCVVTVDGMDYTIHVSSSQGSVAAGFLPIVKGQVYKFSAGSLFRFIPLVVAY